MEVAAERGKMDIVHYLRESISNVNIWDYNSKQEVE